MRSRFSAYATGNFSYVLATYSPEKQQALSVEQLAESAGEVNWFALQVAPGKQAKQAPLPENKAADTIEDTGTVEFTAYYFDNKSLFQLHETSNFLQENGRWYYHDGQLHNDCGKLKYGRNLPCLCNSGKKFKQCCATKMR